MLLFLCMVIKYDLFFNLCPLFSYRHFGDLLSAVHRGVRVYEMKVYSGACSILSDSFLTDGFPHVFYV